MLYAVQISKGPHTPLARSMPPYTPAASVSLSVVLRRSARSQFIFPTAWPQQPPGLIAKGSCFAIPGFVDAVICPTPFPDVQSRDMTNVPLP